MYTLEITKHGYYDLIDEFGIIAAGSKDLVELINTLPHGETIVKGKSMVVDSMESIYDDEDYWEDRELLAMEAQAEYSERGRWS